MKKLPILILFVSSLVAALAIAGDVKESAIELAVGDTAPTFRAKDDQGKSFDSEKLLEKQNLVVYFYPAAMTGGCTKQACAFRDDREKFDKLNTAVVGVSGDAVQNLAWFKTVNNLNFPLLADPDGTIAKAFGVPFKEGAEIVRTVNGKEETLVRGVTSSRWTFIIGKNGTILYKDTDVKAAEDSETVLTFLEKRREK